MYSKDPDSEVPIQGIVMTTAEINEIEKLNDELAKVQRQNKKLRKMRKRMNQANTPKGKVRHQKPKRKKK